RRRWRSGGCAAGTKQIPGEQDARDHQDEPTEAAQSATPGPVLDVGIGFELIDFDRGQVVHRAVLVSVSSNSPRLAQGARHHLRKRRLRKKVRHDSLRQRPGCAGHGTGNQSEKRTTTATWPLAAPRLSSVPTGMKSGVQVKR